MLLHEAPASRKAMVSRALFPFRVVRLQVQYSVVFS